MDPEYFQTRYGRSCVRPSVRAGSEFNPDVIVPKRKNTKQQWRRRKRNAMKEVDKDCTDSPSKSPIASPKQTLEPVFKKHLASFLASPDETLPDSPPTQRRQTVKAVVRSVGKPSLFFRVTSEWDAGNTPSPKGDGVLPTGYYTLGMTTEQVPWICMHSSLENEDNGMVLESFPPLPASPGPLTVPEDHFGDLPMVPLNPRPYDLHYQLATHRERLERAQRYRDQLDAFLRVTRREIATIEEQIFEGYTPVSTHDPLFGFA